MAPSHWASLLLQLVFQQQSMFSSSCKCSPLAKVSLLPLPHFLASMTSMQNCWHRSSRPILAVEAYPRRFLGLLPPSNIGCSMFSVAWHWQGWLERTWLITARKKGPQTLYNALISVSKPQRLQVCKDKVGK